MKKNISQVLLSVAICFAVLSVQALPVRAATPRGSAPDFLVASAMSTSSAEAVTEIWDRAGLEAIAKNPSGSYALMADLDLKDGDWMPIPFSGMFEGNGHTLYNLTIREADPKTAVSVDGNHKEYDTVFAALFSRAENAVIKNLHLLGVDVDVQTDQNAFAAALVGYAENTAIEGCSVDGRVALSMTNKMCGVGGIVGFGWGTVTDSTADVTLTLVDGNQDIKCEQFMGGVLASGYMDIDRCSVKLTGYASVYGYVHNGGLVGMYYVHTTDTAHKGYVTNCTVDAVIHFFEANKDRRAYCNPVLGEQMHWSMDLSGNTVARFENGETKDYSKTLLPEQCETPSYAESVTAPGCENFGYTQRTCTVCGNNYRTNYTEKQHQPGSWQVVTPAQAGQDGMRQRTCTLCGAIVEQEALIAVASCTFDAAEATLNAEESLRLTVSVQPDNATDQKLIFASSDEAVAVVDEDGTVRAVGAGKATITCTASAGGTQATAVCAVTVKRDFLWLLAAVLGLTGLWLLFFSIKTYRNRKDAPKRRGGARR